MFLSIITLTLKNQNFVTKKQKKKNDSELQITASLANTATSPARAPQFPTPTNKKTGKCLSL